MSHVHLDDLASLENETSAIATINSNNDKIEVALDEALSRVSEEGNNAMNTVLDMNSHPIVNLPEPISTTSPLRLEDLNEFIGGGTIHTIPSGGTTNQTLAKVSNVDYDVTWSDVGSGTVTSVGLSLPSDFTVSGSPVTTTGTLGATWASTPTGSGSVVRMTSPTINTATLTNPVISTINNGGTVTLPTSTDTLVGRATTDTLTNKTISGSNNTISGIGLPSLSTQASYTLVGNTTGSPASPTAFTVGGLTQKVTPAGSDIVLIQDQAAGGALKYATVSSVGSSSGVSSVNGQTGAVITRPNPQGRLTLATGTPIMSSSVTGATTVYYTPYCGELIPIYDGTNMIPTVFSELSQATGDATKSPGAVAANSVYDLFVWNDGGTIRCTRGPAWSSLTTRGYTLTVTNGIPLNTSAITNGPGSLRGTYVGTIKSNGSSTIDFIYGTGTAAGTFNVWNKFNQVLLVSGGGDSSGNWTYSSATIRQMNASSVNQFNFVTGDNTGGIEFTLSGLVRPAAVVGAYGIVGVGSLDSTTTFSKQTQCINPTTQTFNAPWSVVGAFTGTSVLGSHFIAALEQGDGTNTFTNFASPYCSIRATMMA